ncbi:NEQ039 [Nanoarchaeum equitans Kin4-M]|uniref:NEQ039 n=1 Tax=Nanoarchaeum equitans (strain Kin4-M) TaxID=228908 RepID=Q74N53_NANEQ|nr:NEQ039 [Nanoarchaeum equitans Kin4-M]
MDRKIIEEKAKIVDEIPKVIKGKDYQLKLTNMVFHVRLTSSKPLDLSKVAEEMVNAIYEKDRFPGVRLKLNVPDENGGMHTISILLFRKGPIIVSGVTKKEHLIAAIEYACDIIRKYGGECIEEPEIKLENMVWTGYLDYEVNLALLAEKDPDAEYNPEQFPGLTYRLGTDKKGRLHLFKNGKIVVPGTRSVEETKKIVEEVIERIKKYGVANKKSA